MIFVVVGSAVAALLAGRTWTSSLAPPSCSWRGVAINRRTFPISIRSDERNGVAEISMGLRGKRIRSEKRRAMQDPTPPRIATAYGPIRFNKPPRICESCSGRGVVRCSVCGGRAVVRATGQRKKNRVPVQQKLIGSQWTSVEVYNGHRHHTVMEVQGSKKKDNLQVRMRNCCGDQKDFWISVAELKDKMVWRTGWQTLEQIRSAGTSHWRANDGHAGKSRFYSHSSFVLLIPKFRRWTAPGCKGLFQMQGRTNPSLRQVRRKRGNSKL